MKRGFLIGEIIDDLSEIQRDLENRASLGIYDLNKYVEDFFREFFNILYEANYKNLNEHRSNEPGLDIGDKKLKSAYQITSTKKLQKIKDTLSKITDQQKSDYSKIFIFIAGKKQGSYSISEDDKCGINFSAERNIIDIKDIMRDIIYLDFDPLHRLHSYTKRSAAKVRIELEIPNELGKYPTSVADYIERIPKPSIGDCKKIAEHWNKQGFGDEILGDEFKSEITRFSKELSKLPRASREFLATMICRILLNDKIDDSGTFRILYSELDRISSNYDYKEDIHILTERNFCSYDEPEYPGGPSHFVFRFPFTKEDLPFAFVDYCAESDIDLHNPLVALDFSEF